MNDNRNYHFTKNSQTNRQEYGIITEWIEEGSSVVDLGCGDGSLLQLLKREKNVYGLGIDSNKSAVAATRKKGINATVGYVDRKLSFNNKQFDYAVCNVTLQMVMYPEILLSEMRRVSKYQIIA